MLFSAVDDRSGVVYDEYRCVYGEDAESALRFLFNAMAPKPEAEPPFHADSGGSRPGFRDDLAHHSDLMSLAVPR